MSEVEAMELLKKAAALGFERVEVNGAVFSLPEPEFQSLGRASRRLDCSVKYLRDHKHEFPNLSRIPGGELRIPVKDIDALVARGKVHRS